MITQSKSPTLAKEGFVKVLDSDKKEIYLDPNKLKIGDEELFITLTNINKSLELIKENFKKYREEYLLNIDSLNKSSKNQDYKLNELNEKLTELTQFSFGD